MYKFDDKVRVTSGVFESMKGRIKSKSGSRYLVMLEGKKAGDWTVEWLPQAKLELVQRVGCCTQCHLPFSPSCNSGTCRACKSSVCPSCLDDTQICIACRQECDRPSVPQANPDLIDHVRPRSHGSWFTSLARIVWAFLLDIGFHSPAEPDLTNVFPLRSRVLTPPSGRGGIVPVDEQISITVDGQHWYAIPVTSYVPSIGKSVDIDFEQPQPMYPELPEMECEQ